MPNTYTYAELNYELLHQIVKWAEQDEEWIKTHPGWGMWDQQFWCAAAVVSDDPQVVRNGECQTAYCIAGQAAHQAGYRMVLEGSSFESHRLDWTGPIRSADWCVEQRPTDRKDKHGNIIWEDVPGGDQARIDAVAEEVLGIEEDEAGALFDGDNTIGRIKAIVNFICERRELPPMFPNHDLGWDEGEWDIYEIR